MEHYDKEPVSDPWKLLAVGAIGLVITIGGLALGIWSQSLDRRIDELVVIQRQQSSILNERSVLAARIDRVQLQTDDQEIRLRAVEQHVWNLK